MGLPLQAGKLQKYISPWRMAQNLVVVGWWMMNMAVSAPEVNKYWDYLLPGNSTQYFSCFHFCIRLDLEAVFTKENSLIENEFKLTLDLCCDRKIVWTARTYQTHREGLHSLQSLN